MQPQQATERLSARIEALVSRFAVMVRSVGVRHGLPEGDLDEVLQEVRIRIWRADPGGEQIGQLGASYVYRTAVTAALDLLRRRRRHHSDHTDPVDQYVELLPARQRVCREVEGVELSARIMDAVDALHPSRRVPVRMYLGGYDREEIAGLMGWTEAKTRNLLYRGLADLRQRLTAMGITPDAEP